MSRPQLPPQRRPVSRQVIRRRRLVALGVVLAFLALVVWAITAIVGLIAGWLGLGPTPSAGPTNATGQQCASGDVMVQASVGTKAGVESESFAIGEDPYMWFTITNVGSVDCTFDVGGAVQFFTIKSGSDQIWTSRDCDRTGLTSQVVTLQSNLPMKSTPSPWMRVRSSASGCGTEQDPVDAGAYNLSIEVNGVLSATNQFLLG